MKLIVAGTRTFTDYHLLESWCDFLKPTEVVCGGALGADTLGKQWAVPRKVTVKNFMPDWHAHGTAAGPIRNKEMALYATMLLAFWDGESRGTKNMIDEMVAAKKPVIIVPY